MIKETEKLKSSRWIFKDIIWKISKKKKAKKGKNKKEG